MRKISRSLTHHPPTVHVFCFEFHYSLVSEHRRRSFWTDERHAGKLESEV
jgi:hypothetical protein